LSIPTLTSGLKPLHQQVKVITERIRKIPMLLVI